MISDWVADAIGNVSFDFASCVVVLCFHWECECDYDWCECDYDCDLSVVLPSIVLHDVVHVVDVVVVVPAVVVLRLAKDCGCDCD